MCEHSGMTFNSALEYYATQLRVKEDCQAACIGDPRCAAMLFIHNSFNDDCFMYEDIEPLHDMGESQQKDIILISGRAPNCNIPGIWCQILIAR